MLASGFYNMDCMEGMKDFPDQFFDLAIVDPPYGDPCGGGGTGSAVDSSGTNRLRFHGGDRWNRYLIPQPGGGTTKTIAEWDTPPKEEYFQELFRVSRNQIIWGGNYFSLPPTRCFLVWRKLTISEKFTMAMCEYAWTNFNENAKIFECAPQGKANDPRFHPTQKPVELYTWVLANFSEPGMKILDTHAGSASSLIACHRAGLEYWGFEIDKTYYSLANERLQKERMQVTMQDILEGKA